MIRAIFRLLGIPRQNEQPPKPRHVPARKRTASERIAARAREETHARLAAELGIEWKGRG